MSAFWRGLDLSGVTGFLGPMGVDILVYAFFVPFSLFTNPREVNAMLDLVKQETERIDSRFLEPACGDGNFLIEILRHLKECGLQA